jgi:hypothetical protein
MYPKEQSYMPNDAVNIGKHKTLSAEYTRNYKHHKHLRQLTLHQLQLYIIIIKPVDTFKIIYW